MNAAVVPHKVRYRDEGALIVSPGRHFPLDLRIQTVDVENTGPRDQVYISSKRQDAVVWYSSGRQFRVKSIKPSPNNPGAPDTPFHRPFPRELSLVVNSGPADKEAVGFTYKVEIEFDDLKILDPEVVVEA